MIFGNTDDQHIDTIYHLQSEAREGELLLQSQVFFGGRCIEKKGTSYANKGRDAQKGQHLCASTESRAMQFAKANSKTDWIARNRKCLLAVRELEVQRLNADSVLSDRKLTMQLPVTGGVAAFCARLTFRFARPGRSRVFHASRRRKRQIVALLPYFRML